MEKHSQALVVASKETGLEVTAEKTQYMAKSREQNAVKSYNIKIDNKSFKRGGRFRTFGSNPNKSKFHSGRH
jgi:hypothetical protein